MTRFELPAEVTDEAPNNGNIAPDTAAKALEGIKARRTRSDAGKPRRPKPEASSSVPDFWIDAPGVKFNLSVASAREQFMKWMMCVAMDGGVIYATHAVDQLMAEIDRLREKLDSLTRPAGGAQ